MKDLILSTGQAVFSVTDTALQRRDKIVAASSEITEVTNDLAMECAVDAMRDMKGFSANVEDSRTEVKKPVLDWGRTIDGLAKNLLTPIQIEIVRLKKLIDGYAEKKRKAAEDEERKRQAELKRIQDEQDRIAKQKLDAEMAAANALTPWEETVAAEKMRDAEAKQREAQQQAAKVSVAVVAPKIEGLTVKKVWKFEVVNIYRLYTNNPNLCRIEANTSEINKVLAAGVRDIPGLKIWEETEAQFRR